MKPSSRFLALFVLPLLAHAPALAQETPQPSVADRLNGDLEGLLGEDLGQGDSSDNALDRILSGKTPPSKAGKDSVVGISLGREARVGRSNAIPMVRASGGIIQSPKPAEIHVVEGAQHRTQESVIHVVRTHVGGFACSYRKYLRDDPALKGTLALRFVISPDGKVTKAEIISSTTGNASLDEEIRVKACRMRFDDAAGPVTVDYAMTLQVVPKE